MIWTRPLAVVLIPWLLWASACQAARIQELVVRHDHGLYTVRFDTWLDASVDAVWQVVTDLENLKELSPRAVESIVLAAAEGVDARLRLVLRPCILLYCKRIVKVSDVRIGDREIQYSAIPDLSDFSRAEEHLRVEWTGAGTRMRYTAELAPTFHAPPLIGPWLIRRVLRSELIAMGHRVERRIAHHPDEDNAGPTR